MQLLTDIWYSVSWLGKAIVSNPPSLPVWATWFTLIIRTIVVLVIFRRNIAPFLLAKVTRRIRARSISILSIKGLYFYSAGRTWRVERIGWSFHPWAESRLSVKIEGLRLDIAKPNTFNQRHMTSQPLATPQRSMVILRAALASLEWLWGWLIMSSPLTWLRNAISSGFILVARLFIRCLSSLTQHLDFELDSGVISFGALSGTQVIIRGATLATKVEFSQMDKDAEVPSSDSRRLRVEGRWSTSHHWNLMILSGADRFWERIWGQMEGFVAVHVAIREIVALSPLSLPTSSRQTSHGKKGSVSWDNDSDPESQLPSDVILRVSGPRILISTQFSPKLLTLQRHTSHCSLDIPVIDASADQIQSLLYLMSTDDFQQSQEISSKNTGPLFSLATSRISSPPTSTSPILVSSVSSTAPFMNAFSQMVGLNAKFSRYPLSDIESGKKPWLCLFACPSCPSPQGAKGSGMFVLLLDVRASQQTTIQPFFTALKSVEVRFPSVKVFYRSSFNSNNSNEHTYFCTIDGVDFSLGLSDPSTNQLHRKWLGSGKHSSLDGSVFGLKLNIGLATVGRIPVANAPVRLLAIHKMEIDLVAHQWPLIPATAPRFLSGDLNGSFVACEISVVGCHLTGRVEDLQDSIYTVMPQNRTSPRSNSMMLSNFPRLELRFDCNDIRASLTTPVERSPHSTSMLVLHSPGFSASLSTMYSENTRQAARISPSPHLGDVGMDAECYVFLQPTVLRVGFAADFSDNTKYGGREGSEGPDPLLRLAGVELSMTCNTLGHKDHGNAVILDTCTSLLDIKCITDDVSVELWKSETILAMLIFVDAVRSSSIIQQATPSSTVLDRLRTGVSAHFAMGCLTCVVTSSDLNPQCDLELSRGLEFCTGISMQYCCVETQRHSQFITARFSQDQDRNQFGLSEDLLIQAVEIARTESDPKDVSAVFQNLTWQTTCRNITSTRYEYGANYDARERKDEDQFIFIPRTVTKALIRRRRHQLDSSNQDTCDLALNLPHFRSHLDLVNTYSALLASHTLKLFTPRHHPRQSDVGVVGMASTIQTTFRLRMANAHIFCYLPLQERMFVRVLSASWEQSSDLSLRTECNSVAAWVSSPQVKGKWAELFRVYGTKVTVTGQFPRAKVAASAEGLRIVIPHRYVLSELILNINLVIKAVRHLHHIISLGSYIPMEPPGAQAPKHFPVINIFIRLTTLEAADSLFEAKLGLIWRTGFQAQEVRRERELAFEAKLRAILESGDSSLYVDSAPQSDLRYRFTSDRSTSLADARARLDMVHSNSWISSISRQKEEICRKEDAILKQLRHAINTVELRIPLPISVHTPEKAPPLFRAVINGLCVSLSPPNFSGGYQGFLADLGGMPSSMEYSLLLPMHMNCSLDAAMMNIRDYPLPLLNVPFHASGPSLKFVTDLIIAEEVCSTDSVEWFQCPVVPHDTGIVGASAFVIQVPKTIMPVKSYANPDVRFCTTSVTEFTWGVSYNPAVQEVMRVVGRLNSLNSLSLV